MTSSHRSRSIVLQASKLATAGACAPIAGGKQWRQALRRQSFWRPPISAPLNLSPWHNWKNTGFRAQFINVKEPNLRASVILTPSPATCNKATLIRQRLRLESARSRV